MRHIYSRAVFAKVHLMIWIVDALRLAPTTTAIELISQANELD